MGTALSAMRANVLRNLSDPNEDYYDTEELNQYIGEAYKKYAMIMVDEGQGYFETSINLSITAGTPLVSVDSLTPPFYSISQLEKWISNGSSVPLRLNERRFKINSTLAVSTGDSFRPTYKQRSMNIVLEPTPTGTETVTGSTGQSTAGLKLDYNYVPTFPTSASADGFTFDSNFPVIWEPLIELYATIRALEGKDGVGGVSDIATFRQTLGEFEARFMESLERDETPDAVEQMGMDYSNSLFNGGYF